MITEFVTSLVKQNNGTIICAVMQEYEISRDEAQSGFSAFVSTLMKDGYITESE